MNAPQRILLPCPFCGKGATLHTDEVGWDRVICNACGCQSAETIGPARPDAIDIWNRRAPVLSVARARDAG